MDVLRPGDHAAYCAIEVEVRRLGRIERVGPSDLDNFLATPCTCYTEPATKPENEAALVLVLAALVVALVALAWLVV